MLGTLPDGFQPGIQAESGITVNPTVPDRDVNFGHLFTDEPNRPLLNQLLFIAKREIASKATGYDVGFTPALLYGSDARVVHTLGVFDRPIHDRNPLAVVAANATARLPWLGKGIDLTAGIFTYPCAPPEQA